MRKTIRFAFAVLALCAIAGCGNTSVDVAAKVKEEMQAELVKKTGLKSLVVDEVVLVKERDDGVDYTGVATGKVDGEEVKFDVACKYDGHSLIWKAELSEGSMAALAAKEKAKEACEKIKAACEKVKATWPEIKESVKQASDAVVKQASDAGAAVADAAGETYDAAKKKAGELLDKARTAMTNMTAEAAQKASETAESLKPKGEQK